MEKEGNKGRKSGLSFFEYFFFFKSYLGLKIFYGMVLNTIIGLLDGIGIAMIFPLFKMVDDESNSEGYILKIKQAFDYFNIDVNVFNIFIVIICLFSLKALFKLWEGLFTLKLQQSFVASLRMESLEKLANVKYSFFSHSDLGRIQSTLGGEVAKVSNAYSVFFNTIRGVVFVLIYSVLAFVMNWSFAIIILVGIIIMGLIFKSVFSKTKKLSKKITGHGHWYNMLLIQYTSSYKYLKATNLIGKYLDKIRKNVKDVEEMNYNIGKLGILTQSLREPLIIIIVLSAVFFYITIFDQKIELILIGLIFFYRALNSIMTVQNSWNAFLNHSGAILNLKGFINDLDINKFSNNGSNKLTNIEKLTVNSGCFSYDRTEILKSINFTINKNETVAFVGESGSGKTTTINVLTGILELDSGSYIVNDLPLNEIDLGSFQDKIGYINQEPVIFDDSIFNNVTFWAEKTEANLEKFWAAVQKASIKEFVDSLQEKENSRLGGNGMLISGGQKQRISIAREFFKEIEILIMDEATSALDSETENIIQENIDLLKGKCTIIIVAHRLSTIKSSDKIFLMSQGEIESEGGFKSLLLRSEKFRKMVELQNL